MKKFLIFSIISMFVWPGNAAVHVKIAGQESSDDADWLYLQKEISKLENELAMKTDKLNKCAAKNKNFQIAGIAAVGLTGIGVVTNVSLYSKMKDQKNRGENMVQDINNTYQKWGDLEAELRAHPVDIENLKKKGITEQDIERIKQLRGTPDTDLSESDKALVKKVLGAVYEVHKDSNR